MKKNARDFGGFWQGSWRFGSKKHTVKPPTARAENNDPPQDRKIGRGMFPLPKIVMSFLLVGALTPRPRAIAGYPYGIPKTL